ncbi:MAG: acyltransferase family protein [Cyanobacteria bacterium J06621_3]
MKNRDLQLDIFRGLAIFSVVLGHIDTGLKGQLIYLFHMPFFFVISGYFHRVDEQEGRYFRRKCISLLLPYFVYLVILKGPPIRELFGVVVENPSVGSLLNFLHYMGRLIYGGEWLTGYVGVFWFVTCLFLTQQLYNFVSLRVRSQKMVLAIAAVTYLCVGIEQVIVPESLQFPWNANVVLCSFLFYVVGSVYGHALFKSSNRKVIFGAFVISAISAVMMEAGFELSFVMKDAYYGFFILSPLASLSLMKVIAVVSNWLMQIPIVAKVIASVGLSSLTVMFFHRTVEYTLPDFFFKWPSVLTAVVITGVCWVTHWLLSTTTLSRALFLGSRSDVRRLIGLFDFRRNRLSAVENIEKQTRTVLNLPREEQQEG